MKSPLFRHPLTLSFIELIHRARDTTVFFSTDDYAKQPPQWALHEELIVKLPFDPYPLAPEYNWSRFEEYQRLINYALLGYCKTLSLLPLKMTF